jgi:23S rRNA (adenine2503-C2)-methyltransferase
MGCPVGCLMCDAGGAYHGKLNPDEILDQIAYLVQRRFPDLTVPVRKFKIQFARMGEPVLNDAVLEALTRLPGLLDAPGLMPSLSTVAPAGREAFFCRLAEIKHSLYGKGRFQLQFSLHSTDDAVRDRIIPMRKWSLERIAAYADEFLEPGDRQITLNFIACRENTVDPRVLISRFDPQKFLIKVTPLNPTFNAQRHGLENLLGEDECREPDWLGPLRDAGFRVLISIGEWEENRIGSNCGQYVRTFLQSDRQLADAYQYGLSAHEGI